VVKDYLNNNLNFV